jgi:hypothetical protein
MAGKGRRVVFHGAYSSKAKAQTKERQGRGRFIQVYVIRGRRRYVVMQEREK